MVCTKRHHISSLVLIVEHARLQRSLWLCQQCYLHFALRVLHFSATVEPPNNGHVGDECFVPYSEVVPSSEILTCIQLLAGGTQFVHCREVVRSSECPLSEVPLYSY